GKVGSGFDVTAAVYGSHIYRRFTPSLLSELFVQDSNNFDNEKFLRRMNLDVWDHVMTPIRLPPLFHMVLGEVDAGSNTLVLVSQVLKWRAAERVQGWELVAAFNYRSSKALAHAK
ncbi:phosphomevalonate kinase, partial [Massospora cicadina]